MKKKLMCGLAVLVSVISVSNLVYANSLPDVWGGKTSSGIVVTGEKCPIEVESEFLVFDLKEFPQREYESRQDYMAYNGQVTAEYTFYNPANYDVDATLLFPFGEIPSYAYYDWENITSKNNTDIEKHKITVNGEEIEKQLRYSLYLYGDEFKADAEIDKIKDSFAEDSFYYPELPVTKYVYRAENVSYDEEEEDGTSMSVKKFVLDSDKQRILTSDIYSESENDKDIKLEAYVNEGETCELYVFGDDLEQELEWKVVDTELSSGELNLIEVEKYTFREFVQNEYSFSENILEHDLYNAIVEYFNEFTWEYGVVDVDEFGEDLSISDYLMQWYQYDIHIAAGGKIVNTVTAPMYPVINGEYKPDIYEYTYLLSPAQKWADFGNLDIVINTPYYIVNEEVERFEKTESGYRVSYNGLPDGELKFTLSTSENPREIFWGLGGLVYEIWYVASVLIWLVIPIMIVLVVLNIKSKKDK